MKKILKNNVLKFVLGGVAIFAFGIVAGYYLNNNPISYFLTKYPGYLNPQIANSSATSANATSSNATSANATSSNATSANATSANASSSNAQMTDDIMYMQNFSLKTTSAKVGGKVYVNIETSGAYKSGASIVFKNDSNGTTFTTSVYSIAKDPYIVLPANVSVATYSVSDVLLVGLNSNNTTFTKHYSILSTSVNVSHFDFNDKLKVVANESSAPQKLVLNSIDLESKEAKINGKVNLKFKTNMELLSLKLTFENEDSKEMIVYVKSLSGNSYFEIPSTTEVGTYNLVSAVLTSSTSKMIYSKDGNINDSEKYAFNSSLIITESSDENVLIYNNEDITEEIIKKLYNASGDLIININADSNPIISLDLFNAIKGTSKKLVINYNDNQIIFLGKNVNNSKSIDIAMNSSIIKTDSDVGKLVNDGILLEFASNGDLPGKTHVKVKITEDMKSKLGTEKIYVYYFNTSDQDFTEIATEIVATKDGYYEFDIEHNSEYILVNKALDSKLLSDDSNNVVSFQRSNKTHLLLIGLGAAVIAVVIAGIVVLKKKNKQKNN